MTLGGNSPYKVYGRNDGALPTSNCGTLFAPSRCDSFSTPCYLIPCMDYNIISVSSNTAQSFQESYVLTQILPWVIGTNQTISRNLTYDTHFYQVQLNNPTTTTQVNFQVISSDSDVGLSIILSSTFESTNDIYSDTGANLTYVIPACQINGVTQSWYLGISSPSDVAATYTLNIFTTNINVVPYSTNNSVVLAPFEVQSFSIAVPQAQNYSSLLNIEVTSSSSDFNTFISSQAPASAAACPNTVQCSNAFNCELASCCVDQEMYYITIVNGLETQNTSVVLTWQYDSYTTNLALTSPNYTVTTTPVTNDVNYYQFLVSPGTLLTSTSILIVNVSVDDAATYIGFNDPAGSTSTCFSYSTSCAPNSPCILQYYACSFLQIPAGPLALGIAPESEATAIISTQVIEPTPLNESQLIEATIQGALYSHFTFEISDSDVSGFNDIVVTISLNGTGDVNGYLNFGSLAGTSSCLSYVDQCQTDDDECVIKLPSCNNGAGSYYLSIDNDDNEDFANVTVIYTVQPSALSISLNNNVTVDGENYSGVLLRVLPSNLTNNVPNYLTATFSPSSDIDSVEWLYDGPICQGNGLDCEEIGESYVCIIDTCLLANVIENDGATIDFVVDANDDTYTVQTQIFSPIPTTLTVGTENYMDSVLAGRINYYTVTVNEGSLGFGESITIQVNTPTCGNIQWYVNQGSFAGTGCALSNCTDSTCPYTFSSCDPGYGGVYYIAVVGFGQNYAEYNVPISYSVSITVSAEQYNLIPIDINEAYIFPGSSNNIYVLTGIGEYTDIAISAVGENSVGLVVSIDALPSCASLADTQTCSGNCTITIPACSKGNALYIATNALNPFNLSISTPSIAIQNITDETPLPINGFVATTDYYSIPVNSALQDGILNILLYNYTSVLALNYYLGGMSNISCLNEVGATRICYPPECTVLWNQCMLDEDEDTVFIAISPYTPSNGVSYSLTVNWTAETLQLNGSYLTCVEIPAINGDSLSSLIFNVTVPFTAASEMLSIAISNANPVGFDPITAQLLDGATCYSCTIPCTLTVSTCQTTQVAVAVMGPGGSTINVLPSITELESTPIGTAPTTGSLSQNFQYTTTATGTYAVITISAPNFAVYVKQGGYATSICYDFGSSVSPIVIACTYQASATYSIFVSTTSSSYTISAQDYTPTPVALTGGVVSYLPLTPGIQVYQINTPQQSSMLNSGDFSISSSSPVNYWLNYGTPAGSDCNVITGSGTSEHIDINACQYVTGNYYATIYSAGSCGPNTISALVDFDTDETATALASGQSVSSVLDNVGFYEVFSFATGQPANNNSFVYITYSGLPSQGVIQVVPSHLPTTIATACIQNAEPYYFDYIGQSPASYYILVLNQQPSSNGVAYPYQLAAITGNFIDLTANLLWSGGSPFATLPSTLAPATFFTLTIGSYESVVLQASVNNGSILEINIYSSIGLGDLISTFVCSINDCTVPLVRNAANYPSDTTYTIVVYSTNSNFSIGYTTGSGNCATPPAEDLFFCSVSYSTWDYGNFTAKDNWAQQEYYTLYAEFTASTSTSCNPTVLSEDCTTALKNFVCATAFPLCDSDGFTTGLCNDICTIVQQECEIQFDSSNGLGDYTCGTTSYIDGSQAICGGCTGYTCNECNGSGDSCSLAWWIIVLIVVGAIAAIAILAGGYYLYKKRSRGMLPAEKIGLLDEQNPGNYESIPDN